MILLKSSKEAEQKQIYNLRRLHTMTLVKSLVPCELVSIYKHGSWYQVAFADTNRNGGKYLSTLTLQGVKSTRETCRWYNIVHTKGTPVALSSTLDINSFVEGVDPS